MAQTSNNQHRRGVGANTRSTSAANPGNPVPAVQSQIKWLNAGQPTARSRSCSTLSNRQPLNRVPLTHYCEALKARKVLFYRNGDQFFKGLHFAIKNLSKLEHYQTFELLLAQVNASSLCDPSILKQGVRYIFTLDGFLVTDCDQLVDGHSYVCSSTPIFKSLNYEHIGQYGWISSTKKVGNNGVGIHAVCSKQKSTTGYSEMNSNAGFVPTHAKTIVVIRAGPRPRRVARKLLNKRTARTLDQVLTMLAKELDIGTGIIRHLCSLYGRPVEELQDLFSDEQVFIAFGKDKYSADDLKISDTESKYIDAACGLHANDRSPQHKIGQTDVGYMSDSGISVKSVARQAVPARLESEVSDSKKPPPPADSLSSRQSSPREIKSQAVHHVVPKVLTKVNRGYAGKELGIPIPLLNKYKFGRSLFAGEYVTIKRCFERSDKSKKLALKIVSKNLISAVQMSLLENELSLIRRLHHDNLIMMIDELDTPNEWYSIMELFQGSDLYDAIVTSEKFRYTETDASQLLRQVIQAVQYLHSLNVAHRNIRLENILVNSLSNSQKVVKLGDFGLAVEVNGFIHETVGSEMYHSPEMFTSKGYGLKADVWAIGIVMYVLLCGFPPFGSSLSVREALSAKFPFKRIVFPSPYWDKISDAAKDLILFMLEPDQFIRGSTLDMLEHPWLADPAGTANDIDLHDSVAAQMTDLLLTSKRFIPPTVGLIAVTALDKGMGLQGSQSVVDWNPFGDSANNSPRN